MAEYHYSLLVDRVSDHPYKAGLLIKSLMQFGKVNPSQIHVHCTNRVEERIVDYFSSLGCHTPIVEPYLDRKYCNKIRQVGALKDLAVQPSSGVCFLDVDIFNLEPFNVADPTAIWGKTVDAANPPIEDLERIFDAAGVEHPETCQTDWGVGQTFCTNYNGGVLYVPTTALDTLDKTWRKWAEFLFSRPDLITNPQQRIHVDQISFCLALADIGLPTRNLLANSNFPGHSNKVPASFNEAKPISMLHYHWCIDRFGFLKAEMGISACQSVAIEKANKGIATYYMPELFEEMKMGAGNKFAAARMQKQTDLQTSISSRCKKYDPTKRLILHGGTPKTGTSSLQRDLGNRRAQLLEEGIWYPPPSNTPEPKHQQIVGALQKQDGASLLNWLFSVLDECPENCHTIFITSEGIYNHWWDHSSAALTTLSMVMEYFQSELWFVLREPVSFAQSLYVQYLKNPKMGGPMRGVYGEDEDFLKMFQKEWYLAHFDYLEFYYSCSQIFGADKLKLFGYEDNISEHLIEKLLGKKPQGSERRNKSLGMTAVRMLRKLNRLPLEAEDKALAVGVLKELDGIISGYDKAYQLSKEEAAYVSSRTQLTWHLMQSKIQSLGDN